MTTFITEFANQKFSKKLKNHFPTQVSTPGKILRTQYIILFVSKGKKMKITR